MQHASLASSNGLIADVATLAARKSDAMTGRDLFIRLLLSSADEAALSQLPPEVLADVAIDACAALAKRQRGTHQIRVRTGDMQFASGPRRMTVIDILNDDMPFLVASILAEVHARGLALQFVLHPIFKVDRAPDGTLLGVAAPGDRAWNDGRQESYIGLCMDAVPAEEEQGLVDAMASILDQVRRAVGDWSGMLARVEAAIADLAAAPVGIPEDQHSEAVAFLKWLRDGNFTFLGARDYRLEGDAQSGGLHAVENAGLGLLRDPSMQVLRRGTELVAMTPEVRRFFFSPSPLIITKANVVSRVHRRVHMDYVGIKLYGARGLPTGELRLVGLFTSTAYTQSVQSIPLLRQKVRALIDAHGAPPESHAGKALINVLETFPRDELIQIARSDLQRWTSGILDLEIRPRIRVFTRTDRFDRFVSALVYVPRERYSSSIRERIGAYLAESFDGVISAFYPSFGEGPLARVHFIVGRRSGKTPVVPEVVLEQSIAEITQTWADQLEKALLKAKGHPTPLVARYRRAFSAGYAEAFDVRRALEDIGRIERLGPDRDIAIDFYVGRGDAALQVRAAIYRFDTPVTLSERVPVLENMGFTVIDERTYRLRPQFATGERDVILHDMLLETSADLAAEIASETQVGQRLEDGFIAVAQGHAENDGFNKLIAGARATWREVTVIRYYAAYLRQLGSAFGIRYVSETLARHAGIVRDLLALFAVRFNPDLEIDTAQREERQKAIRDCIESKLSGVASLDEDRILRQLVLLVRATVRTSAYRKSAAGEVAEVVAFKFEGRLLEMAPAPRSYREIWVAGPRVEGVHLRFAPIARGGIRWSDRPLDFRTEVLGLAKAQQVKNAVIVPAGAKGGFFPKRLPSGGPREAIQKEGIEAYKIFVSAMLDITDDIRDGKIMPPARVVRYDGDDPYLVVAADKGTATFSDIANSLSTSRGFWLADAFASGGSAGYDHKGIAITSRGAWECVKRHFREIDVDIQATSFRVAGVGDMSGDVFGNGMLRSDKIRLVAAFDHRDIFLDPNPDPAISFAERKRLFALPRSSWGDYDRALISAGGGVFSRAAKAIPLSAEMRRLLSLDRDQAPPADVIRAILTMEVDLLFFGGIGTYIRSTSETDADVGDRVNDPIRITGADVRAKVIGEGANLGMTQRGRIEAAMRGVRLNTDFIDNSAGVNCSDQEVNIKIALGPVVVAGRMTMNERNELLRDMTSNVAGAVLVNNYQQSLALTLAEQRAAAELQLGSRLIRRLERTGILDRRLEALPSEREMEERLQAGRGLTRPELAILSSYAKIAIQKEVLATPFPDDPALQPLLLDYFPQRLRLAYSNDLVAHRLRREIVATAVTNELVNRLGAPMPHQLADDASRSLADVARAFMAVCRIFALQAVWRDIDQLDGKIPAAAQLKLYQEVRSFVGIETRSLLRHVRVDEPMVTSLSAIAQFLRAKYTSSNMPGALLARDWAAAGVPTSVAEAVAILPSLHRAELIREMTDETSLDIPECLSIIQHLTVYFDAAALAHKLASQRQPNEFDQLASDKGLALIERALAATAIDAARAVRRGVAIEAWLQSKQSLLEQTKLEIEALAAVEPLSASRVVVTAMAIGERFPANEGLEFKGRRP